MFIFFFGDKIYATVFPLGLRKEGKARMHAVQYIEASGHVLQLYKGPIPIDKRVPLQPPLTYPIFLIVSDTVFIRMHGCKW